MHDSSLLRHSPVARRVGGLEMIPILLACMRLVDRRVGGLVKHNYGDRELLRRCPPRRRFRNVHGYRDKQEIGCPPRRRFRKTNAQP